VLDRIELDGKEGEAPLIVRHAILRGRPVRAQFPLRQECLPLQGFVGFAGKQCQNIRFLLTTRCDIGTLFRVKGSSNRLTSGRPASATTVILITRARLQSLLLGLQDLYSQHEPSCRG